MYRREPVRRSRRPLTLALCCLLAALLALPAPAAPAKTARPAFLALDAQKVDYINLYPAAYPYAFCLVEEEADRAALLAALGALEAPPGGEAQQDSTRYHQVEVRLRDGKKYTYECRPGALVVEGRRYGSAEGLAGLYGLVDGLAAKYPRGIQWLGYMNAYRIEEATLVRQAGDTGGATAATYQSTSEAGRAAILEAARLLRGLRADYVACREDEGAAAFDRRLAGAQIQYRAFLSFDSAVLYYITLYSGDWLTIRTSDLGRTLLYKLPEAESALALTRAVDTCLQRDGRYNPPTGNPPTGS